MSKVFENAENVKVDARSTWQVTYKDIFRKLKDRESEAIVTYSDDNITCFRDIDKNVPKHLEDMQL